MNESTLPQRLAAIRDRGHVVWVGDEPSAEFKARFDDDRIPVAGIRHVRVWGLQVDDERALPHHERVSIPDEELWQVDLISKDGSKYEVNAALVRAAPRD